VAQTKGISFVNVRAFVIARAGEPAWEHTLQNLSGDDRQDLATVVAVGWYDLSLYARLIRAVDSALGAGDLALLPALGRFEAERDLTTIHRLFLRMASPAWAIEKTMEYWRRFHDSGEWRVQRSGEYAVSGTLDGWGVVDEALCLELTGYLPRVMELAGAKRALIEHRACRARGARDCFFSLTWEPRD
jgi:hypothetical protein